jgi:hypothetical protein
MRRFEIRGGGCAVPSAARPLPVTDRAAEIAEQLTLSIRTVEGHVYRACYKVGVADRDELAELMRP